MVGFGEDRRRAGLEDLMEAVQVARKRFEATTDSPVRTLRELDIEVGHSVMGLGDWHMWMSDW